MLHFAEQKHKHNVTVTLHLFQCFSDSEVRHHVKLQELLKSDIKYMVLVNLNQSTALMIITINDAYTVKNVCSQINPTIPLMYTAPGLRRQQQRIKPCKPTNVTGFINNTYLYLIVCSEPDVIH